MCKYDASCQKLLWLCEYGSLTNPTECCRALSICNFKADKCYVNSNFATLLLCITSCQVALYIENKRHWIYFFFKKSKRKFRALLGLKFVFLNTGADWPYYNGNGRKKNNQTNKTQTTTKPTRTKLSSRWTWAKSVLLAGKAKNVPVWSQAWPGLFALMKRWWFSNRLCNINSGLHCIPLPEGKL